MKHIILLLLAKLFVPPISTSLQSSNAKISAGMDHRYNESRENHDDIMQKIIEIHEKQKLLQFLENDRISILEKLEIPDDDEIFIAKEFLKEKEKEYQINNDHQYRF
jgi:hypothetical protein